MYETKNLTKYKNLQTALIKGENCVYSNFKF